MVTEAECCAMMFLLLPGNKILVALEWAARHVDGPILRLRRRGLSCRSIGPKRRWPASFPPLLRSRQQNVCSKGRLPKSGVCVIMRRKRFLLVAREEPLDAEGAK